MAENNGSPISQSVAKLKIDDGQALERWLRDQNDDLVVAIAFRIAARVLPLLSSLAKTERAIERNILPAFRALCAGRFFAIWGDSTFSEIDKYLLLVQLHAPDTNSRLAIQNSIRTALATFPAQPASATATAASAAVREESLLGWQSAENEKRIKNTLVAIAGAAELWRQMQIDLSFGAAFGSERLLRLGLWQSNDAAQSDAENMPEWLYDHWLGLRLTLEKAGPDWPVWTDWYDDILNGWSGASRNPEIERARLIGVTAANLRITEDDWKAGPTVVNPKIRQVLDWLEGQQNTETADIAEGVDAKPAEPEPGPGPNYAPVDGKLDVVASLPQLDEAAAQQALHGRLKAKVEKLTGALASVRNQYPELADAVEEYADLVAVDTTDLDVTGVWSVGGALAEFVSAYRNQNTSATMAVPLEPQLAASLSSITRDHGAFILGFAEGRELVERADDFALKRELLQELQTYGQPVLEMLASNRALVSHKARQLHKTLLDATSEFGWASSRLGYTAYVTVRKAVFAMIRHSVGEGRSLADIVAYLGGASVLLGDPNGEFIRAALPVLRDHGAQLLAFFNHSPEFRAWVEWALKIVNSVEHRRGRD